MKRLVSTLLVLITLSACAATAPKHETPPDKVFKRPFSVQTKIISELEWKGLEQIGSFGSTEYVAKSVPGMQADQYATFDDSIIVAINAAAIPEPLLAKMREIIRAQVGVNKNYSFVEPSAAQAGIASIFSPFTTKQGMTWELLVIVFDRAKMAEQLQKEPGMNPLDAVFRSGIRAMVSHLYPETDLNFAAGTDDPVTVDGIHKLYSRALANFLEPLVGDRLPKDDEGLPRLKPARPDPNAMPQVLP